MKAALKKAVDEGVLLQVKSSYKLSAAAKEVVKPKKVVKKDAAAVKKTMVKKVCSPLRAHLSTLVSSAKKCLLR
jgi:hypothetical protein